MVYQEELPNKSCALQREAAIKKLSREEKLKLIDKGNPLKAVSPDTTT
jgi:predicted GIY-YIG superfamily endonuclease